MVKLMHCVKATESMAKALSTCGLLLVRVHRSMAFTLAVALVPMNACTHTHTLSNPQLLSVVINLMHCVKETVLVQKLASFSASPCSTL